MNRLMNFFVACILFVSLNGCSVFRKSYQPEKKYSAIELRKDFTLFRSIIERKHPSAYWYITKPKMDSIFDFYESKIQDSTTDQDFLWHVLSPAAHEIRCGHTTVRKSKKRERWEKKIKFNSFPLSLKLWNDTLAVIRSAHPKDSIFKRGTIIKRIDQHSDTEMIQRMMGALALDGYAKNVNTVRIGNNFPLLHRYLYGVKKKYVVDYINLNGERKVDTLDWYEPIKKDSSKKKQLASKKEESKTNKQPKSKRLDKYRKYSVDSTGKYAVMTISTFSNGQLRRFFRKSFRDIEKRKIEHVVIDLRSNGGGKVSHSTLLTKYVSRKPFKVADSVYSTSRTLRPFLSETQFSLFNELFFYSLSYKKKGTTHHISRLENKMYQPKKKNHYAGQLYILTHGPTFSASTLFSNVMKGQEKVTLIGEETGGGWYGNSGIIIPDFVLPNTKLRLRMPLFRVVQSGHCTARFGKGIPPDVPVGYSLDALINGKDLKMKKAIEMIEGEKVRP
jgi:C-terminal processing protease CtpA/Prc